MLPVFHKPTRSSRARAGVIRREFLTLGGTLLGGLACAGFSGLGRSCAAAEPIAAGCQLRDGDVVALCGDSITSNGHYPSFLEAYQLLCGPKMAVTFANCGRWGENARDLPKTWDKDFVPAKPTVATICYGMNIGRGGGVLKEPTLAEEAKALKAIIDKFKSSGGRTVILGSPGCVDTTFHSNPSAANSSLAQLRDNARKVARETGAIFADVHTPMIEVMAKAKAKHGNEYPFAGGKGDGLHPGQAGHLVMAWAFLKALGYDGQIGTLTVELDRSRAEASEGHKVLSFKGGVGEVESARYPFCFLADSAKPKDFTSANSTRSVVELFPFNADLNRLTLVVRGAKAEKVKITWGGQAREFEAEALKKGINLAAEFLDNPFAGPFGKIMAALSERNSCRGWLKQEAYKNDPSIPRRLEAALKALVPVPVKHEIKIEPTT